MTARMSESAKRLSIVGPWRRVMALPFACSALGGTPALTLAADLLCYRLVTRQILIGNKPVKSDVEKNLEAATRRLDCAVLRAATARAHRRVRAAPLPSPRHSRRRRRRHRRSGRHQQDDALSSLRLEGRSHHRISQL